MSRPLRLDAPGLLHHITNRGNDRKPIFRDDTERQQFLDLLAETARIYGWIVHAWVLLGNHFHLVVETPRPTLSIGMQYLDGEYAKYFNRKRKRSGHLFKGRFDNVVVEKEAYFMNVMRYVALNPVRARMVERPEDYRWSSYRATAGYEPAPPWLEVNTILSYFGKDRATAQEKYREFVCRGIGEKGSIWDDVKNQIFLGTEGWLEKMRALVESKPRSDEHPLPQRAVGHPSVQKIIEAVAQVFDIDRRDVQEGSAAPRTITAWLARYEGMIQLRPIAAALRLRSSGYVSSLIRSCEETIETDPTWRCFVDRCLVVLRRGDENPLGDDQQRWPVVPLTFNSRGKLSPPTG